MRKPIIATASPADALGGSAHAPGWRPGKPVAFVTAR